MSTSTDSRNWKHTGDNQFTKPLTVETVSLTGANITNNIGTYNYIIEKVGATYYARSITNTLYSGTVASTVINSAITALTSGGKIYFKPGTYDITAPLTFDNWSNIKLEGAGYTNTIFTSVGNGGTIYQIVDLKGQCSNIEICGIAFVSTATYATQLGKGMIYGASYGTGTTDMQYDNINIHHCSFTNTNLNMNAVFFSVHVTDGWLHDFKFTDNYLYNVGRAGIEVLDQIGALRAATNVQRINISNNYFTAIGTQGSYGMGISVVNDRTGPRASDVLIQNNTFYEMQKNQSIEVSYCERVVITGNKVQNVTYHTNGITLLKCVNTTVGNNTIDVADPDSPGTKSTPAYALSFNLSSAVTVSGNVLKSNTLSMTDVSKSTFTGNTIATIGYYNMKFFNACTQNKIHGNIFDCSRADWVPNTVVYFEGPGTGYNEVTDNIIIGTQLEPLQNYAGETNNIFEINQATSRTSTADGVYAKLMPGNQFVKVTSGSVNNLIVLPEACTALIGKKIRGTVGANGFELRVAATQATTVYINNVTTNVEAAIPANTIFEAELIDDTHWILKTWNLLGAEQTPIIPDAI